MYQYHRPRGLQVSDPRELRRRGLGIDPITAGFAVAAISKWVIGQFGKGRREADVITEAVQQLESDYLGPLWGELQWNVTAADWNIKRFGCEPIPASVSTARLRQLRDATAKVAADWLAFLRDRSIWQDGRASGQSANWQMAQMIGHSGYGLFASGGGPSDHVTSGDPSLNTPMDGPPVCGGIVGAIDREIARRNATATTTTTAPTTTSQPAVQQLAPGSMLPIGTVVGPGSDLVEPVPWYLVPSSGSAAAAQQQPAYYGGGGGFNPLAMSTAAPPAAGGLEDFLPWILAGGLLLVVLTR